MFYTHISAFIFELSKKLSYKFYVSLFTQNVKIICQIQQLLQRIGIHSNYDVISLIYEQMGFFSDFRMGNGESSAQLFVANDSGGDVWLLLTPSKEFPLKTLLARDFGLSHLAKAGVTAQSVLDIYNAWTLTKRPNNDKNKITSVILNFFKNAGLHLDPDRACDVYDRSLNNPLHYLSAYGWGVLNTTEEICVTVLVKPKSGDIKMAQFRTLSNWSWVINSTCVTLTKKGSQWEKRLPVGYPLMKLNVEED